MHQYLAAKIGGKQGLAATILVPLATGLIIAPTAVLMSSLGDSVHQLVTDVQEEHARDPPLHPRPSQRGPWSAISCMRSGQRLILTCLR